jgi:hypothetical protein
MVILIQKQTSFPHQFTMAKTNIGIQFDSCIPDRRPSHIYLCTQVKGKRILENSAIPNFTKIK